MSRIVAARFDQESEAAAAAEALRRRGFQPQDINIFFLGAPGQHATFPVGGDRDVSPGATQASGGAIRGALIGGVAGLAVGLVAVPVAGVVAPLAGAGVGAYTGSLVGALRGMKRPRWRIRFARSTDAEGTGPRQAGVMLAARVTPQTLEIAIELLQFAGGQEIEHAEGHWDAGRWADFDPLRAPRLVDPRPAA